MTGREEYVTVEVTLKGRTDRAIKVDTDELFEPVWAPRSTLHFNSDKQSDDLPIGAHLSIKVMEWVASQKGLI